MGPAPQPAGLTDERTPDTAAPPRGIDGDGVQLANILRVRVPDGVHRREPADRRVRDSDRVQESGSPDASVGALAC